MAGRKTFTAGEVLQAADVNDFLMDQSVMVFAGTAARGSAIPSPTEGMVTYLEDSDAVQVYTTAWEDVGVAPAILQVVSTTKTDTFSASTSAGGLSTEVTGLTASITPSSTSSKVLVLMDLDGSSSYGNGQLSFQLLRGGSAIAVGDAAGSRTRVTASDLNFGSDSSDVGSASKAFLDSPASTSSLTYSFKLLNATGSTATLYVNRSSGDSDLARTGRSISTITLMEVAG